MQPVRHGLLNNAGLTRYPRVVKSEEMKGVLVEVIKSTKNATVDSDTQPLCAHQPDLKTGGAQKSIDYF